MEAFREELRKAGLPEVNADELLSALRESLHNYEASIGTLAAVITARLRTLSGSHHRYDFIVGVSYTDGPRDEQLMEAIEAQPEVLKEPTAVVVFEAFWGQHVDFSHLLLARYGAIGCDEGRHADPSSH